MAQRAEPMQVQAFVVELAVNRRPNVTLYRGPMLTPFCSELARRCVALI